MVSIGEQITHGIAAPSLLSSTQYATSHMYVTGPAGEDLLVRNKYLATEKRILRNQVQVRIRLTDPERISLASAAKRLGRKALEEVAQIVRPETILAWHCRLIARKFDGNARCFRVSHLP